jgi:hypothetical protein
MQEIVESDGDVCLSSERLASLSPEQADKLASLFSEQEIQILILVRSVEKYLDSTWRHAVFWHDFAETRESFMAGAKAFSFQRAIGLFASRFPTHVFDIDEPDCSSKIAATIGTVLDIGHANVGVPEELASLLQKAHSLMGTAKFKAAFPFEIKDEMRMAMVGERAPIIDPLDVVIF